MEYNVNTTVAALAVIVSCGMALGMSVVVLLTVIPPSIALSAQEEWRATIVVRLAVAWALIAIAFATLAQQ